MDRTVGRFVCGRRMGLPSMAVLALSLLFGPVSAAFADDDALPPVGTSTGLADSAALRSTVFGASPLNLAPQPELVPLTQIDIKMPWRRPVPEVFWFNKRLRVYFSKQPTAAPLAIVIAGTGSDGNTSTISTLRGALYGAGYHVLSLPSPTFPGFIVSTSSTGVAGDLRQDGRDLYQAIQHIIANLPKDVSITDIDVLGYSLGGANAAVVKSIDSVEGKLGIRRAVLINPPVSLFNSIGRLDKLFVESIGEGEAAVENLYQRIYVQLANLYRVSDEVQVDENFLLSAAANVLRTDAEFSAAIALTFRIALVNMFFAGDLYAKTGVVVDPKRPPRVGDSLATINRALRSKPFSEYFDKVFAPFYMAHRAGATRESLVAENHLNIIADAVRNNPDYLAQTNSNDLILDRAELEWLRQTFGDRIAVYDHGGHLGNIGEREQIADLLEMLAGRWQGGAK
jgi:hypothetical protein